MNNKYLMAWIDKNEPHYVYIQTDNEQYIRTLAQRIRQYDDVYNLSVMINPDTDKVEYLSGFIKK